MALGSGRIYHAKGARAVYKLAMKGFDDTIAEATSGACMKAHDALAVANQDFGSFFTEFKHAVGSATRHSFSPMGAPRMRAALSSKRSQAQNVFAKKCVVR